MGDLLLMQKAKLKVFDGFNRDNNAISIGKADTGQTWTVNTGAWGISSNKAYCVSDTNGDIASIETLVTEQIVECTLSGQLNDANTRIPNVLFRMLDTSNYLMTRVTSGLCQLYKADGGVISQLASTAQVMNDNTGFTVSVVCSGMLVVVKINEVEKISHILSGGDIKYTDYTLAGFRLTKSGSPTIVARWDNFVVRT